MSEETGDNAAKKPKPRGKKKKAKSGESWKNCNDCRRCSCVLGATGALSFYMGWVHAIMGWEQPQTVAQLDLGDPILHPFTEIKTDLKSSRGKTPFLRAVIHIQLFPDDLKQLQKQEAQVHDAILTHCVSRSAQQGKEGSERLRFELVQIINNLIQPAKIHTIYFKELIVQ